MNKRLYVYILIIPILLGGCMRKKDGGKQFEKKDIAPNSLNEVSIGISTILKATEMIEKIMDGTYVEKMDEEKEVDKTQQDKSKEEESDKQQSEDSSGNEQEKQNSSQNEKEKQENSDDNKQKSLEEEKSGNKEEKTQEKNNMKLLETWESIEKEIKSVHEKWNSYESKEIKKGIPTENVDLFRNSLNKLTKSIENRNVMEIYDFASQSLSNLNPLFEVYKDEIKGDINKLKYHTYRAYLLSLKNETDNANETLKSSEKVINLIRSKLEEDNKKLELLERVNISINDMEKALNENSIKLNRIKKDIVIKNLEELER